MKRVLMCGSTLTTKGGMVSVVKNYLDYTDWGDYPITYIPTHFDGNKFLAACFFGLQYVHIFFLLLFRKYYIAHLHTAERGSFWRKALLLRLCHRMGVKVVLHHHGAEFEEFYAQSSQGAKRMIQNVLMQADANIVLSNMMQRQLLEKQPKAHCAVLYNAVATRSSNPYNVDASLVLFLGRLGKRKGVFDLLEAIKKMDKHIPYNVKFALCGDMGEKQVSEKVAELRIAHRVVHIGWIDGEQKQTFLANTMINCLPSYNEGLPMTILETMAYGIPNISTNIAAIPEVIRDGENGMLIEPGDIACLTEKLQRLIGDKSMRIRFSENAYSLINSEFSLLIQIDRLKEIYNSL